MTSPLQAPCSIRFATAIPAATAALMALGLITSAQAQVQTAGALLVNIDATSLPAGPLLSIPNAGTMGGVFESGGTTPVIAQVYGTGTKGIQFDGGGFMQHKVALAGALMSADPGLTGVNPTASVEVWALNPQIPGEETMVSWGHRNGGDGQNMSFNYGYDARWGAVGHWGGADIGWDSCCNSTGGSPPGVPAAGVWHHLVYTYDGTTQRIFVDGLEKNSEAVSLNTYAAPPITIAGQLEDDAGNVTGGLRGSLTIGRIRIHQEALTAANVANNYNFEKANFTGGSAPATVGPIHRYRFANPTGAAPAGSVVTDSIGTAHGAMRGAGATFTGTRVKIGGGSSASAAYIDLPNGLLSVNSAVAPATGSGQITLEGWTKINSIQAWSRILDFGSSDIGGLIGGEVPGAGGGGEGRDYVFYSAFENVNPANHQLGTRNEDAVGGTGGGGSVNAETPNFQRDFHFAITWDEASGNMAIYENGNQVNGMNAGAIKFNSINDVNVWLGRSNWNGDANLDGEYDEFRIYDKVLTAEELARSAQAGPTQVHLPGQLPAFDQQPVDTTVQAQTLASFSAETRGAGPMTYQWFRGANPIAGANSQTYSFVAVASDNGAQFKVRATGALGSTDSSVVTLTVLSDTTPPALVGAAGGAAYGLDATHVGVRFTEPVNATDAVTLGNYSLPGYVLSSPALLADNVTVVFAVAPSLKSPTCKTLTVNNIRDRAPAPNTIAANSQTGVIYAEGTSRYSRFNTGGFPNLPDVIAHPPLIENPEGGGNHGDNYTSQGLVLLAPPVTGNYRFYLASDDDSALFLSTDENPANKVQIAREPAWGEFRAYNGAARSDGSDTGRGNPQANISNPVTLTAGCRYYLEVVHHEGGGGDYFSVAWQTPAGGPNPGVPANGSAPIGALYISPFETAPSIAATDPVNQTLNEGRRALLTAAITGSPILTYQWFSNGVAVADGTNATYNTPTLRFPGDNGVHYKVTAVNSLGSATSRENTITVIDDATPPHLVSAEGTSTFDKIIVRYDEPVDPVSGIDTFNYTIAGIIVLNGVLSADGQSVTLNLDPSTPLAENTLYTVQVDNVGDAAVPANIIAANSTVQFRSYVFSLGFLLFQAYDTASTPGNAVSLLTSHPNFPNNPRDTAFIHTFNSREAYPNDSHEQYGGRMSGVFVPPVSGNYLFYLASDDASQLFLNPGGNAPGGKVLLTEETGCCNPFAAHASGPQSLVAGQAYYIEGLWKEGGGGDFMQAAAKLDSDPTDPNSLSPIGPGSLALYSAPVNATFNFTQQPASQSKFANQTVTFTVAATVTGGTVSQPSIQWQRSDNGGTTWVNIPNANGTSYSKSFLTVAGDNGAKFRARLFVPGASSISSVATLTVTVDNQPPHVVGCTGSGTMDKFTLTFDEPVDPGSAQDPFNYSIAGPGGPLMISSFSLSADGQTLTLTTDQQLENRDYTITIDNVTDIATPANTIAPGTTVICHSFVFSCGFVLFETYNTPGAGTAVSLLTSSPNYPNNPRERFFIPTFDTRNAYPDDSHEQFGGRISGQFVPKVSGNYIFYIRSDDASELWLNPTGPSPGGAVKIQEELGCCGAFSGHATPPQALTAGQTYFIMALYKEGGGGDFAQVAAKLDTDPANPDSLTPIGPGSLGLFANPAGATINVTQQPVNQAFCQISAGPPNLANESFNACNGGFTVVTPQPTEGPWVYDAVRGTWHEDGQGPENSHPNTTKLNSPTYSITQAGAVQLTFRHRWSFEYDGTAWDGGNLQMSINGGAYAMIPAASFTANGYNGTVAGNSSSDLHGQPAFINESAGFGSGSPFITTTVNLGIFSPGTTIAIQFFGASDSNTKNQTPTWELDTFALAQGILDVNTVTFSTAANASLTGVPNQTIFYQWQRNNGAGFIDIPTANGSNYTFLPKLTDNGACFRVTMYIPGKVTNSQTACLTVTHRNTPPEFNCGPNIGFSQNCAPQSLTWATSIVPDSIHSASGTFTTAFASGVPAGSAIYGNAHVDDGYLHLTDAVNGQIGSIIVNDLLAGAPLASASITFNALVGGGTTPPADGLSVSIANNLPNGPISEEGDGTGLIVAFDAYDNGGGEAPAIDVKWAGTTIAHTALTVANFETFGTFVPISIILHADGTLDVTAAGTPVYVNLVTGYAPIAGARFGIGARTGGLNMKNFIDDLTIVASASDDSLVEASQQIQFQVSNNNPALFSEQPAISPNGTLTYTPSVHAAGVASVTVVAKDNGGVACGGSDTSQPCVFTITLNCGLTARDDGGATRPNTPITIAISKLLRNDGLPQGNLVTPAGPIVFVGVSATSTNGGTVTMTSSNVTYTPRAGFSGIDRFSYTIGDSQTFGSASVEILVVNGTLPSDNQVALIPTPNGVLIRFAGIPGRTYQVQRATAVVGPWTTIATLVAPLHGIIEYLDTTPPQPTAFYRTTVP